MSDVSLVAFTEYPFLIEGDFVCLFIITKTNVLLLLKVKRIFRILGMSVVFFSIAFSSFAQQKHFLIPVEFKVENGSTEGSVVKVSKEGNVLYSLSGKSNMRLQLDFNKNYLISFSKQGFITKSISIETNIPSSRLVKTVQPYKIGVVLYKQYEGINIVVYNQPVAKIHFSTILDEFDFDTDYTKSILSNMSITDEQLKQKAIEERLAPQVVVMGDDKTAKNEKNKNSSSSGWMNGAITTKDPKPVSQQRNKLISEPLHQLKENAPYEGNQTNLQVTKPSEGEAQQPPASKGNGGEEATRALNKQIGDNDKNKISSSGDSAQHNLQGLNMSKEERLIEKRKDGDLDPGFDINEGTGNETYIETSGIDKKIIFYRQRWDEKGRSITVIKIRKGLSTSEYRKVNYAWGGLYYFKGQNFTISPGVYRWATGEY